MMNTWAKIAILLTFCNPVSATNLDYDTQVEAWRVACRYVKADCKSISVPGIALNDSVKVGISNDPTTLAWGGYNEKTRTIHLINNIPDDRLTGILIHEYIHHILHVTGKVIIVRDDIKTICESESQAFKHSHRWMRLNNKQHHVVKWKKHYKHCQ